MDHNSELNDYWSSDEARVKYWDKRAHNIKGSLKATSFIPL